MTNIASERARRLRREKGEAERRLWRSLRALNREGYHFRQQAPLGPYIVDFCEHSARLVIELDGAHHGLPPIQAYDRQRSRWLEAEGYKVLRFWNREVQENSHGVETAILLALGHIDDSCANPNGSVVSSPLVGEEQGGGDSGTVKGGLPPTPFPSPQGGGGRTPPGLSLPRLNRRKRSLRRPKAGASHV
ncbi:MAG: endonuclease domain-containing protein [Hyphomicrobiales bacterium]|nr:MAG: endonuclease domain-containing protein [Hyphomicrobiales bacterium]